MFLYHYYDKSIGPFKNLSDLSMEEANMVLLEIAELTRRRKRKERMLATDKYSVINIRKMLELVWREIEKMQYMCGGIVAFLEAEDKEKVLDFYQNNRFVKFDTRQVTNNTEETHELIQLLRLL